MSDKNLPYANARLHVYMYKNLIDFGTFEYEIDMTFGLFLVIFHKPN